MVAAAAEVAAGAVAAGVAAVGAVAAEGAAAAGSVASGSVAAGSLAARVARAAAYPGERAACAKSHDLTAGLTKDSAKLRSASRWLRV